MHKKEPKPAMKRRPKSKTFILRIDEELYAQVSAYAAREDCSVADAFRRFARSTLASPPQNFPETEH